MASSVSVSLLVAFGACFLQCIVAQTTRSPQDMTCAGYCTNPSTAPTGPPPSDVGTPPQYTAFRNACTDQFCCCDAAALGCQYNNQQVACDPGFVFDPNQAAPGYTCRPVSEMNQIPQCCASGNVTTGCPTTRAPTGGSTTRGPTTAAGMPSTTRSPQDATCAGYCTNQATAPTGRPPADLGNPAPYTAYINGCSDQFCCCNATALGCQYNNQQVACDPGFVFDPNQAAPGYSCRPVSEMSQIPQCCASGNVTTGCPTTRAPTTIAGSTTRAPTTVAQTTTVQVTTARPTTVIPVSTTAAPPGTTTTAGMPSTTVQVTTTRSTTVAPPGTTTAAPPGTTTAGAPPPTTTSGSCAGCACGSASLSTETRCVEETPGPTGNAQWKAGLDTNVDITLAGGDVIAYQIQWSNASWSGWYVTGVNDIDIVPGTCGLRRMWAYFTDLTHKQIICRSPV